MNHIITLQGYDGSTTVLPFDNDNTITIATIIQQCREQTGHSGYIELFDMDHSTEQPVEDTVVVRSNKTFLVQKSEFTQRDRPYTQRDRPFTQRDRPHTQETIHNTQ